MPIDLGAPPARARVIARRLKQAFDDIQDADSGWWYVDFDHPIIGRPEVAPVADRIPGDLIASTGEPGPEADALIVAVGFPDPYTGDIQLGTGIVAAAPPGIEREPEPAHVADGDYADRRLPAVALYDDGGRLRALIGRVHTAAARFEIEGIWPDLEGDIVEWLKAVAQETSDTPP